MESAVIILIMAGVFLFGLYIVVLMCRFEEEGRENRYHLPPRRESTHRTYFLRRIFHRAS